jgi:hypothetical protein
MKFDNKFIVQSLRTAALYLCVIGLFSCLFLIGLNFHSPSHPLSISQLIWTIVGAIVNSLFAIVLVIKDNTPEEPKCGCKCKGCRDENKCE